MSKEKEAVEKFIQNKTKIVLLWTVVIILIGLFFLVNSPV